LDDYKYTTVFGMEELSTALHLTDQIHSICQRMWKISWNIPVEQNNTKN